MEENPEGEIKEMVELYVSSGVSEADAQVRRHPTPMRITMRSFFFFKEPFSAAA